MPYRRFGLTLLVLMLTVIVSASPSRSHDTTACIEADPAKAKKECHPAKVKRVTQYARVRHQIIWDIWRRDRMEDLAHLLSDVMRPGRDGASAGSGLSVV
jgi:hypothetical protein